MRKRLANGLGVAAATVIGITLAAAPGARAALVIDSFDQTSRTEPIPAAPGPEGGNVNGFGEVGLSNVPGGSRFVQVRATTIDVPGLDNVVAQLFPDGGGFLDYNSSAGADGLLLLLYNGNRDGASLDLSGLPFLDVNFAEVELPAGEPPLAVRLEVLKDLPQRGEAPPPDFAQTLPVASPGPQSLRFDLSPLADRSDLDVLTLTFDAGRSGDFRLGAITAQAPEPAGLTLLAAALAPALLRRQRRRPRAATPKGALL